MSITFFFLSLDLYCFWASTEYFEVLQRELYIFDGRVRGILSFRFALKMRFVIMPDTGLFRMCVKSTRIYICQNYKFKYIISKCTHRIIV